MAHPYSAEDFLAHTGKGFRAEGGGPELKLQRVDVMPDVEARERAGLPPGYTVIFSGPSDPLLAEGQHVLVNDEGARFEVYVIPIHTAARDRQDYQVVFS